MDTHKIQEKKIIKSIFLTPIFSLLLFAIILCISLYFYIQEFQKEEINEYKNIILKEKKEFTKNILLSEIQTINHKFIDLNQDIKKQLKERVNEANDIINRILSTPNKSKKEKIELIKNILNTIRFNHNRGYYFAYDKNTHISLIHPIKKFINKDMSNFKDKKGVFLTKLFDNIVDKKNEGYAVIYFAKPSHPNKEFKKIVYVRYIPQLNWVIGTGEYVDDALNELKKEILEEIETKRYGKNCYFWIHSVNYTLLAHPFRQKDIGKNDKDLTDIKENKIIQLFIQKAKHNKNGAFVKYYWKNPNTKKIEEKISFVYYIPKFEWVIGTGLYLKDLQFLIDKSIKKTKKEITQIIIYLLIILIISIFITMIISYKLSLHTTYLFNVYKNDLENKIQKAVDENIKKDMLLQQQSKLAAMGEMISAIAHQWRQPLNSLSLNLEVLLDKFYENKLNKKYIEEFTTKQKNTIQFMSKTIDDFRNFFIKKEKEKFSIKQAILEVIELINAQLKNNNISIELQGEDFTIKGYKNEFKQVILNLINNAKDAIIELNKPGKITITLKNKTIIIEDTGKEIPKEIQNRIFEPYFSTKGTKGTGIGLYMSKIIIEEHMDGKLYFEVNNNKTKFIIEFKGKK